MRLPHICTHPTQVQTYAKEMSTRDEEGESSPLPSLAGPTRSLTTNEGSVETGRGRLTATERNTHIPREARRPASHHNALFPIPLPPSLTVGSSNPSALLFQDFTPTHTFTVERARGKSTLLTWVQRRYFVFRFDYSQLQCNWFGGAGRARKSECNKIIAVVTILNGSTCSH